LTVIYSLIQIILTLVLVIASCQLGANAQFYLSNRDELEIPVRIVRDLAYGPNNKQGGNLLDLYLPARTNQLMPLVVWIHGGGWREGTKEPAPFFLLTKNGFALASINYRLSKEARFPAQIQDCAEALKWLSANARMYNIDKNRIGIWGGSAGGHLVALIGTARDAQAPEIMADLKQSARGVKAACDWCGPTDLTALIAKSPKSLLTQMVLDFLPQESVDVWARQASPVTYANKNCPSFLIVHGDKDNVVPIEQGRELSEMLKAKGADCSFVIAEGDGHNLASDKNVNQVLQFFRKTLKPN
jgi:acetyl esterase/lipase